jgi:SAM-dependent methyltransferase
MLPAETFLNKLQTALDTGAFVKLTLSSPLHSAPGLRNVYGRVVSLKGGPQFSILLRYATRDITKNYPISEARTRINTLLETEFASAHLFTTSGDWELRQRPGDSARLSARRATFTVIPPPEHDRLKSQSVPSDVSYLQSLGVTNAQGAPKPGMADKLRQIQRFVEVFGHLLSEQEGLRGSPPRPLQVVDMGSGKGYLTFAIADFLRNKGFKASVKGVEFRADLVELTNQVAKDAGMDGLHFEQGTIAEHNALSGLDVLIALHACDTATDDALFQGISSGASLIITAPCCHKELRPQITPPPVLADVFRHGILCERESEILTDSVRALLLEIHGYKASVFEFVSHEHTGKNLMLAAVKRPRQTEPNAARRRLRELLVFYGITTQRLARLLGELEVLTPGEPSIF